MKKLILSMALASLFTSSYAAIEMTPDIKRIKEQAVLKIGVRTNAPPFSLYNNGSPEGYIVDLCNTIYTNLQKEFNSPLKVQYVPVTTATRFELLEKGEIDLECGTTTVTKARRERADFSYNTFITSTNFVTRSENKIHNPKDFYQPLVQEKKKVALMKGSAHEEWVKGWARGEKIDIILVENLIDGIKKVQSGEAYVFIQDKVLIEKAMFDMKVDKNQFFFSSHSLSLEPYSIMVRKGNTALLNYVNSELRQFYKTGGAKSTLEKYFVPNNMSINYLNNDLFRNPSVENAVP